MQIASKCTPPWYLQNLSLKLNKDLSYKKFGIDFHINKKVIEKELQEYEEADCIAVPSHFVKNSFLEYGFDEKKLFHNPYGTSAYFKRQKNKQTRFSGESCGQSQTIIK